MTTRSKAIRALSGTGRGMRRVTILMIAVIAVFAIAVLYLVYRGGHVSSSMPGSASGYRHVVGEPGIGDVAPGFTLTAADGKPMSLADYRGHSVLLYFHEGLSCQPCWDQIRDLEKNSDALHRADVDAVVSITTDPADLIGRKTADEGLSTPVLSDPTLAVSRAYHANDYGMMGDMRDGHSFVLVGPDGKIRWRADYGGKPDYTMFVPTPKLLADLTSERVT
jgi:peroxiredoxin